MKLESARSVIAFDGRQAIIHVQVLLLLLSIKSAGWSFDDISLYEERIRR